MNSIQRILRNDRPLKEELDEIMEKGDNLPIAKRNNVPRSAIKKAMIGPASEMPHAEAMIRLHLRPALLVRNNKIQMPDSAEMRNRLRPFVPKIEHCIPSVGRIEFLKAGRSFGGTGWMISENTIVTNRHVAALVAEKKGKALVFRKNAVGEAMEAVIDFKEEYFGPDTAAPEFEVEVERVVYMTMDVSSQPDIAFLRIKKHKKLPPPIPVSDRALKERQFISVIGYPAYDPSGIISRAAAAEVFKNIFEVKRCSPGEVMEYSDKCWYFFHDCTTLGGNSGSAVIDNETGAAVGLHFMGEVEKENYAVKGPEIIKHFRKISPRYSVGKKPHAPLAATRPTAGPVPEATPESFDDRQGYDPAFLGQGADVALPKVVKNRKDVLKFVAGGSERTELKYHHFSVMMNQKRRICFFSACNIDGTQSKRGVKRSSWKFDPRFPKKFQIKEECYGNPPKFARGHMTRKEDPIWGDMKTAVAAGDDTFHVPNAAPQMQPFNAPVWLALEDYALENARQDKMRISVVTGPVFSKNDPVKYGVAVPVEFFKVIAFIHDETRKLCATGYTVSQADYLKNEEFVYGAFETYQVSIKSIERRTGLSFGVLVAADPLKGEEAFGAPLTNVEEIRFR